MHGRNAYLWAVFRRAPAGGWILPLPERGRAYGDGRTVKNDFSMDRDRSRAATGITFGILWALSVAHLFNDTLQSVIAAIYPMLKHDLTLSFAQIGLITLIYQLAGSVFQPLAGLYFDKCPSAWALPAGMAVTMFGLLGLAYASSFAGVLAMTALTGIGSSVFHPEASRLTSLASGGHRGLAQSLFQVGGNLGYALGPLLVAVLVAPYGRAHFAWFAVFALVAVAIMVPISRWYKRSFLDAPATDEAKTVRAGMPLSLRRTVWAIAVLLVLIFSKYMYMAALTNYYTFYLIHKFGVTIGQSQILLFVFLAATAFGTMLGGPAGDRFGRKYVIWASILGTARHAPCRQSGRNGRAELLRRADAFVGVSRHSGLRSGIAALPAGTGFRPVLRFRFRRGRNRGGGSRRSGRQSRNRFHLQPVRLYAADRAGGVVPSQSEKIGPGVRVCVPRRSVRRLFPDRSQKGVRPAARIDGLAVA